MIMAGQVRVSDQVTLKPATAVAADSVLTVDSGPRFVSRGGEKLDAALEAFRPGLAGQSIRSTRIFAAWPEFDSEEAAVSQSGERAAS